MRSRIPIGAALVIALLALIVTWWAFSGDPTRSSDVLTRYGVARPAGAGAGAGAVLLKDRPLPTLARVAPAAGGESQTPGVASGGGDSVGAEETAAEAKERRRRGGRPESPAARQARLAMSASGSAASGSKAPSAATGWGKEEVQPEEVGSSGGVPEPQPVPTFPQGSIYDGLSQDDLLELFVASKRLRDAGVFQKLTPEQFLDVQRLLPQLQGVQDANEITQRILGMNVGEWLDMERGPKGRFVLQ